ncbi:MAG: Mur ligase family protein, partial [Phycisphaerae bacterium]
SPAGASLRGIVETGGHTVEFLADADVVVASPGVPLDSPILNELHRRGVYVMSELELSYQLLGCAGRPFGEAPGGAPPATGSRSDGEAGCLGRAKRGHADPTTADMPAASNAAESPTLIAVTGTVGKRTTVELLRRVWHAAGRTLRIGGNRGRPLSELLRDHDPTADIAVAVSSFQLETVVHFRPRVAVLLNLSDAHLDRHRSVAEYLRIKSRVFMNQQPDDALILPFDDPRLAALARKHAGRTFFVSARQPVDRGAWLVDGHLSMNIDGRFEEVGTADTAHPENLLATVLIARLCGITTDRIAEAVSALRDEGDAT